MARDKMKVCAYIGTAIGVIFLLLGGILFFLPVGNAILSLPVLFILMGVIIVIATIILTYQSIHTINRLLHLIEARNKKEFSSFAHDIRNILAIIQTDAEIALMGDTPKDELTKALKRVMAEVNEVNLKLNRP